MRKIALVLSLVSLASCSSFGWSGRGGNLTDEQRARGLKDPRELADAYDSAHYWQGARRRADGRNNAFGRSLQNIGSFIDRHFWNYDENDPAVNYASDTTMLQHFGRFGASTVIGLPVVEDITRR
jgi:hypothetical protein